MYFHSINQYHNIHFKRDSLTKKDNILDRSNLTYIKKKKKNNPQNCPKVYKGFPIFIPPRNRSTLQGKSTISHHTGSSIVLCKLNMNFKENQCLEQGICFMSQFLISPVYNKIFFIWYRHFSSNDTGTIKFCKIKHTCNRI